MRKRSQVPKTPSLKELTAGLPLVDSTRELTVQIKNADRTDAIARDPGSCVVSKAVQRESGPDVVGVFIGARMAYVSHGDWVERFMVSAETSDMIRAYDLSGYFPVGVSAKLTPIPPSRALGKASGGHTPSNQIKELHPKEPVTKRKWLRHL